MFGDQIIPIITHNGGNHAKKKKKVSKGKMYASDPNLIHSKPVVLNLPMLPNFNMASHVMVTPHHKIVFVAIS